MKKRLNSLSIYRLVATICILQFHIFFILYNRAIPYETLLSKGVQGLTALSGFLYSQKLIKDNKSFWLNNLKKIIIPALICFSVMLLWNLIYMFIFQSWNYIGLFFDHRVYNNGLLVQPGNYYYIAYIAVCYLITPVLQRNDKWSLITSLSVIVFEFTLGFFTGASIIILSYVAGYFIGRKSFKQITDIEERYSVKYILIFILITAVSVGGYILLVTFPFNNNYFLSGVYSLLQNIAMTTFGVFSFFLFIYIFRWTNRFNAIKPLSFTDKITLNVYLLNQTFMCGAMNVARWVEAMWLKTLLVYVFTIGFAIITYLIYDLIFNRKKKEPKPVATA